MFSKQSTQLMPVELHGDIPCGILRRDISRSSVGPGDYSPNMQRDERTAMLSTRQKRSSSMWLMAKCAKDCETPGPGEYNVHYMTQMRRSNSDFNGYSFGPPLAPNTRLMDMGYEPAMRELAHIPKMANTPSLGSYYPGSCPDFLKCPWTRRLRYRNVLYQHSPGKRLSLKVEQLPNERLGAPSQENEILSHLSDRYHMEQAVADTATTWSKPSDPAASIGTERHPVLQELRDNHALRQQILRELRAKLPSPPKRSSKSTTLPRSSTRNAVKVGRGAGSGAGRRQIVAGERRALSLGAHVARAVSRVSAQSGASYASSVTRADSRAQIEAEREDGVATAWWERPPLDGEHNPRALEDDYERGPRKEPDDEENVELSADERPRGLSGWSDENRGGMSSELLWEQRTVNVDNGSEKRGSPSKSNHHHGTIIRFGDSTDGVKPARELIQRPTDVYDTHIEDSLLSGETIVPHISPTTGNVLHFDNTRSIPGLSGWRQDVADAYRPLQERYDDAGGHLALQDAAPVTSLRSGRAPPIFQPLARR
eukprot:GEMP01034081.1.p1 GENE.GEMP01034081.1~~GEMP01034081.1.p1  ORF type:complete len:551 (+),score=136.98 GEMP01034081.1:36-1655(+)